MTVALDEDLLAPMLAGWQKVADCYALRAYVYRAAAKILAVTNKDQGFGELVTIIEPTPRPEEPARTASAPTGPTQSPVSWIGASKRSTPSLRDRFQRPTTDRIEPINPPSRRHLRRH